MCSLFYDNLYTGVVAYNESFHLVNLSGSDQPPSLCAISPVVWGEENTVGISGREFPHFSNFAQTGDRDLLQVVKKTERFILILREKKK